MEPKEFRVEEPTRQEIIFVLELALQSALTPAAKELVQAIYNKQTAWWQAKDKLKSGEWKVVPEPTQSSLEE